MNCYFFTHDRSEEEMDKMKVFLSYVPISMECRDKISEKAKAIANKEGFEKSKIYIVSEDEMTAIETALAVNHALGLSSNNLAIDERLNYRKVNRGYDYNFKSEKKRDYTARIFEAMSEIIMSHENDDIIIFVAGDHLFKTCQNDTSLHALTYFGDEYLVCPLEIASQELSVKEFINYELGAQIASQCLNSEKQQNPFEFEKVILEAPEISNKGIVKPVYLKYAEKKLKEEMKSQNQGQMGE